MFYKNILNMIALVFFLISTGAVFAVEPTTFPTNKTSPYQRSNNVGVLVEPTALERSDPRSRKIPGKRGNTRGVLVEPTALERVTPKSRGNKFSGAKRKASSHRTSGSKKDAKRKKTR